MKKKRVSSVDLAWMIFERLRDKIGPYHRPLSIAVIPDADLGWRAIVQPRSLSHLSPAAIRHLRSIEKELQAIHALKRD